jgi:hypothetical protein
LMQANCAEQMFHPRKKDSSGFWHKNGTHWVIQEDSELRWIDKVQP